MQDNAGAVAGGVRPQCLDAEMRAAQAARKDPHAFLPLYERYVAPIYRYCLVRLGDRAAAEDATSEVFLKAIDKLSGYRGGSFPAWLFTIARNVVTDHARRQRPERLYTSQEPADTVPSPEGLAIAATEHRVLHESIERLTRDQRALLTLQLAGWQDAQIAEALGRTRDAVKMLRLRALKRLRDILSKKGWNAADRAD